jgi:filamentous hemagglutinin
MGGGGTGGGTDLDGKSLLKPKWPTKDSQLKHIFSKRKGHVADTLENRRLLESVAFERKNLVGKKQAGGSELFVKQLDDGRQVWIEVRNGIIQDAGLNDSPRSFWPGLEQL